MVANGDINWLLFLLHGSVLDTLHHPDCETDRTKRDMACSGLDTVCRMMLDIAQRHGEERAPIMPLCCFYNLRAAAERMRVRNEGFADEALARGIECLVGAEVEYRKRWVF